jgi:hypothetical protein
MQDEATQGIDDLVRPTAGLIDDTAFSGESIIPIAKGMALIPKISIPSM